MKTKKIIFVLSSILLSLFSAMLFASITDTPAIGLGILALGLTTMSAQLAFPNLNIIGGAMFELINPAQLTFNGKELQSMTEAIMESVYTNPDLAMIHQITENIVAKQQIGFLGLLKKISKKDAGCNSSPSSANIPLSEKFWEPVKIKFWLEQCADDLEETFFVWGLQKGIKRKDLTGTDFEEFVMERMDNALIEDIQRIVWFADTDVAHTDDSPAGILSPTSFNADADVADYNHIDGFWKQIYAAVATTPTRKIAVSRNAQASYVLQAFTAADTANQVVTGILQDMVDTCDARLSGQKDKFILITRSMYNQYKRELKYAHPNIESAFVMIQNGIKTLTFDGIPLIQMEFWDRAIVEDFNNGTVTYQPHRAVLTIKANIPVGVDGIEGTKAVSNFYLPKEETNNWKGAYKLDAKLYQEYLFIAAY